MRAVQHADDRSTIGAGAYTRTRPVRKAGLFRVEFFLAALLLGVFTTGVAAQVRTEADRIAEPVPVRVVLNAADGGFPVGGVFVEVVGTEAAGISNEEGRLLLEVPPGTYLIRTSHLAYHDVATALVVAPREEGETGGPQKPDGAMLADLMEQGALDFELSLRIRAIPLSPIMVEVTPALNVIERRRNFASGRSKTFDQRDLREMPSTDVLKTLSFRAGLPIVSCDGRSSEQNCWAPTGGRVRICVYLDEYPLPAPWVLGTFPVEEIGFVELFPGAGMVRVYTQDFLRRVGDRPGLIQPIEMGMGCEG